MAKNELFSHQSGLAMLYAVPIGLLGGLIGLGGAEFRLPVLAGPLGYAARQAVPLNLAVSFVTLTVALLTRASALAVQPVGPLLPAVGALSSGAVLAAFLGATLAGRLSEERLEQIILALLVAIGIALIIEGVLPQEMPGLLPPTVGWHVGAGMVFGLAIGLVSSLLGVAGGELIIPTLVFAFGADIKTAGTASLLISVPTVGAGLVRYASRGAFAERRPLITTVVPMSLGSLVGAVAGGLLVGLIPAEILKIGLGVILNVSALRIFRRTHVQEMEADSVSLPSLTSTRHEVLFATTASAQDAGLLDVILPLFEKESGYRVQVRAIGTGRALAMAAGGKSDVVLTHAPDAEKQYLADGTLVHRRFVMHNTFLLAGPAADPAGVKGMTKAPDAFRKIADAKVPFVSRGDDSGTYKLERQLWVQAGITPVGAWYCTSDRGMRETLRLAGEKHAYVLSDRATYLVCQHTTGLVVLLEGDRALLNPYHVLEVNPERFPQINGQGGKRLADFLLSPHVQEMLARFGVDKFGEVLFHPGAGGAEKAC